MQRLNQTWNRFSEFLSVNPWFFLFLIPVLFHSLPSASHKHSIILEVFNQVNHLAPATVQADAVKYEPAADKLLRSIALTIMIVTIFSCLGQSHQSSVED